MLYCQDWRQRVDLSGRQRHGFTPIGHFRPFVLTASLTTAFKPSNVEDENALATPFQSGFREVSWGWISGVPADDDGIAVTVSIPDVFRYATATDLRSVGWNGTQWIYLSCAATASSNTENSTLTDNIPVGLEITQIGIGSLKPPLPVTMVSFLQRQRVNRQY